MHLEPYHKALFQEIPQDGDKDVEVDALFINLRNTAKEVIKLMPEIPNEASTMLESVNDPGQLADLSPRTSRSPPRRSRRSSRRPTSRTG